MCVRLFSYQNTMKDIFDFNIFKEIEIDAIVKKIKSKKRKCFSIEKGTRQIDFMIDEIKKDEEYRFISFGAFSSICFIKFISERYGKIKELYASTLRVGEKYIEMLSKLDIDYAFFMFGSVFKNGSEAYGYFEKFDDVCKKKGLEYIQAKNHSKIILIKTEKDNFVIETSSNLNENPEIEQFVLSNNYLLFEWYKRFFEEMKK